MASSDASPCDHNRQRAKARQPIFTGLSMEDLENWLRQAVAYNSVCHFALKVRAPCHGCTVVFHYYIMSCTSSSLLLSLLFIILGFLEYSFPQAQRYSRPLIKTARPSIPTQFIETFGTESARSCKHP